MNIQALDLNLLVVFEALYEERHVGRAAKRIGLTQPATSNALARLRSTFDDVLFERRSAGMTPTVKAEQLAPALTAGLRQIRLALSGPEEFRPLESTQTFRIAMPDYVEWRLMGKVMGELSRIAPQVRVQVRRAESLFQAPEVELRQGQLDAAIGFYPDSKGLSADVWNERLFEDEQVMVARRGHGVWKRKVTMEAFAGAGHAAVILRPEMHGLIDAEMAARGYQRRLRFASGSFLNVVKVVAETDLIACLPAALARGVGRQWGVESGPLPFALPPFVARLVWSQRVQHDLGQQWMRELIRRVVSS